MFRPPVLLICAVLLSLPTAVRAGTFELQQEEDGVTVKHDGQLFTRYVIKSHTKPILWPLIGPYGDEITRQYPMREALPTERADHPHQRSCWFTHGDVNGVSFWHEGDKHGDIVHREFVRVAGGPQGVIAARHDWIGPDGKRQCADLQTITFGTEGDNLYFDFDITLTATDGPVVFGDTKEGTFGVRVAGTMKVDAKLGGQIVNSEGATNADAWAKAAAWCDYHGPVKDKVVGIAVMNHPSSFRFPTYWHVRTYGLYAANPFGVSQFTKAPKGAGAHTLEAGQSLSMYYRVLIHPGDEKQGGVAAAYERYAKTVKKPD